MWLELVLAACSASIFAFIVFVNVAGFRQRSRMTAAEREALAAENSREANIW